MLEIRRAYAEDTGIVGRITSLSWQAAYRGIVPDEQLSRITPEFRAERFLHVLPLLPDAEFYVALVDGEPVGTWSLQRCRDDDAQECHEIGIFYFLPEYWGRGCAQAAMAFSLDRLRALNAAAVVLWVFEENLRARAFYEKMGFAPDGGRKAITIGRELIEIRYRK
jgi:RimJ/RimL family protein N-acetyltransferase